MLVLSHFVNLAILVPLVSAMMLRPESMTLVFGTESDARRILICLYATILLASIFCLILLVMKQNDLAIQISQTLFAMQVVYKLLTVPMVGFGSPVVITNLVVVAVHSATLATLWFRTSA